MNKRGTTFAMTIANCENSDALAIVFLRSPFERFSYVHVCNFSEIISS